MKTTPYWFDSVKRPKFRSLARSLSTDVLIIGAGVTGLIAAYLLRRAGLSVALLERERLASRDSGHTTAHLTCVTDKRLHELVSDFGEQHAKAAWDAGIAAIDEIETNCEGEEYCLRILPGTRVSACTSFWRKIG
jgi:glycine/D-amino acid oxidase-like deaminating enzyme